MDAEAKKILERLKAKKYDLVYVLQGEETYYIDLIANYIEAHVLNESEKGFNQVVLYGKDSPVNVILTNAKRFPMMAERQVIIVREAQDIPDLQKEAGAKLLLDYFVRPVPSTILVLCHKHKTLDKRKELGKKVDQLTTTAIFKKPYESQLPDFVASYTRDKGFQIEDGAIRVLTEYVGNDLTRLSNEIDKVLIGANKTEVISPAKVMAQVGISREYNIFELQKALILKDTLQLTKILNYFEGNVKKNPAIPLVAFLFSFFSKLLVASTSVDKSERGLVNALKISPYAAKDYINALQRFRADQVMRGISLLKQADLKLKGVNVGSEDESQVLKELVFRLII
jgi:DNA polymerase III subunit delta